MTVAIISAVWKRPEIFKFFARGVHHLTNSFPQVKFDIVISGSEGTTSETMVTTEGFHYIETPNSPLSDKFITTTLKAKELKPDYVLLLGSDDIIHPSLFSVYLNHINNDIDFVGLTDLYFYNILNGNASYWKGKFCGAGALMSSRFLDAWCWKPWVRGRDRLLDSSLIGCVQMHIGKKKFISLKDHNAYAIDIKGETNITPFELWPNTVLIPPETILPQFEYLGIEY